MNVAARERQRWPKDYRIDTVDLEAEAQIRHSSLLLVMTLFPNVTNSQRHKISKIVGTHKGKDSPITSPTGTMTEVSEPKQFCTSSGLDLLFASIMREASTLKSFRAPARVASVPAATAAAARVGMLPTNFSFSIADAAHQRARFSFGNSDM